MVSKLYEKVNYTMNVDNLISHYIREYDIVKANINILYREGLLSKERYDYFYNLPKMEREVAIGILQRNENYSRALKNGIIRAKKEFFEANNIQDWQVLAIKNDAIYLIDIPALITKIDNIEFKLKNIYTSFYHIDKYECYYYKDPMGSNEILDVKGISDSNLELHKNYFLEFLKTVFDMAQKEPVENILEFLKAFNENYMALNLDVEFYREFNAESLYALKQTLSDYNSYKSRCVDKSMKKHLDISYNTYIIRKLYQIYSSIYFSHKK